MSQYSPELSWDEWCNRLTSSASSLLSTIRSGKTLAEKWAAMTYGLTDAQIQALPQFSGKSVADITAMRYALGVFTDLHNAVNNVSALGQADRNGYLTPFSI